MSFKRFALPFCLLCAVILGSCGDGSMVQHYNFNNLSSYTVQITLSQSYTTENVKDAYKYDSSFSVYKESKKTVYVQKNNVDFKWSTSSLGDIPKVSCEVNGSTATFRNR